MSNEKPMSTKVRDMVLRIMERAMYYNDVSTKQELTGEKPTFFVNFSGHCGIISVHCYPYGYRQGAEDAYCGGEIPFRLCESEYITEDEIINDLHRILSDMEDYYDSWYFGKEKKHEQSLQPNR